MKVRARTRLFINGRIIEPGDVFESASLGANVEPVDPVPCWSSGNYRRWPRVEDLGEPAFSRECRVPHRLVTVYFEPGEDGRYDLMRLARVYKASAESKGAELECVQIATPGKHHRIRWVIENTAKLEKWREIVHETKVPVILTDADMLYMHDPSDAFLHPFDVAFTRKRSVNHLPINGGVFFARPTDGARRFMDMWCDENRKMVENPTHHHIWRSVYGGINQSAMGRMIQEFDTQGIVIASLPCEIYNAVEGFWDSAINRKARLIHAKGILRELCLGESPSGASHEMRKIASHWLGIERSMR